MKKIIGLIVVLLILIVAGIIVINPALFSKYWQSGTDDEINNEETQLPNPASIFCEDQGGILESRDLKGGQYGICRFDDGSECGDWEFYRDECAKGERFCEYLCGDSECQEIVCQAVGCPCAETAEICPEDCLSQ